MRPRTFRRRLLFIGLVCALLILAAVGLVLRPGRSITEPHKAAARAPAVDRS
jgi:hypothetical protein